MPRKVGRAGLRDMIFSEGSYWFSSPGRFFACLCFFVGMTFRTKYKPIVLSLFANVITTTLPLNYTMSSPVVTVKDVMDMKKHTKTKIGVGYVVKSKVGYLEKTIRVGIIRRMRKDVVVCVHSLMGKKKFLVQFEYEQKKEIRYSSLVFLSLKEEVEMDEAISHSTKK